MQKISIRIMARKNDGVEIEIRETTIRRLSVNLLCFTAARIPKETPKTVDTIVAPIASLIVLG